MAYVYEHWRPDTNTCFYVGKGRVHRARYAGSHSAAHRRVVAALTRLGLKVNIKIVADDLGETEAFALETRRISYWRKRGIKLVNQRLGGAGGTRAHHGTPEAKANHRAAALAQHADPELKARHRKASKTGHNTSEAKAFHGAASRRNWADSEIRARAIKAMKAGHATDEAKARHSAAAIKRNADPEFQRKCAETRARNRVERERQQSI